MACTDNVMRALFLLALFCVMHGEKEESKRIDAKASGPGGSFDITKLGASGNGKIDNTKAVQEAWASACGDTGKQTILIPKGDFLVGQLNFTGPCKGDVTIHVDGNLLSTMDLSQYKEHGNWIEILRVDNLVITGKGNLDGLGPAVWSKNSCAKNDDCISFGPGTSKVNITGVTYGSGHGISIGSLGRYKDEKDDTNINVKDCTLKKTTFGVRIKAYEDAASVLTVSKIHPGGRQPALLCQDPMHRRNHGRHQRRV
ncbi:Pectin lyase-like superfamily protein [Zea mays]|uniref:Pectin lyase-like superfamily protein n=1 Tax=Zea mays TaxID=4577 RepID=A0A1D6LRM8_MAIZE|nr:Pectin lyase-like superfamily protein [Zea mays]